MHKRPFAEITKDSGEVLTNGDEQEAEVSTSAISEPATKLVRIDDENKSYVDKGIQVESSFASNDPINVNCETSNSTNQIIDDTLRTEPEIITIYEGNNDESLNLTNTTAANLSSAQREFICIDDEVKSNEELDSNSVQQADYEISPEKHEIIIIEEDDEVIEECNDRFENTEETNEREEGECESSDPPQDELSGHSDHSSDKIDGTDSYVCPAASSSDVVNFQDNDNDASTEIEIQDETSSSSSGVASITNSSDETATTSSAGDNSNLEVPLRSVLKVSERKPKIKRKVIFDDVTVFYFRRSQGFTCVPSQGGSTLGMENTHSFVQNFTLESHEEERKRVHREILMRQRRFARMNKHSSTSESEDDSCDDLSDISDTDLENDSCYFLQPVPIKQRRALLRASGVRKIETAEKEDCRDIRLSREFCGCECRVYCNPESCACNLAGIKCQVDRVSFPCGCSRDGCANSNGRIEFNPLRVRTHFIHTIMRLEMEKKQNQSAEVSSNSSAISTTDSPYSSNATVYPAAMSSECTSTVSSSSANVYLPVQSSHSGYLHEPSMVIPSSSNSYMDPNIFNEFSPESNSYSENSEYTSDDFEDDYPSKQSEPVYQPPLGGYINSNSSEMLHNSVEATGPTPSTSSCSSSNTNIILPPFPTISCDLSSNLYKDDHCQPYSTDSTLQMSPYSSYSSMGTESVQQSTLYPSYGMHTNAHYNYSEFPKEDAYAEVSTSESVSTSGLCGSSHSIDTQQQQYIDLSLSMPPSTETLITATTANISSGEGSCLPPVSFSHIQPPMASNDLYPINISSVQPLCVNPTYIDEYNQQENAQDTYVETVTHGSTDTESGEDSEQASASHSSTDNFGEIIKKSIVESVSA